MSAKLKAAIEKVTANDMYDINPSIQDEIDIVLAAARAYACEECGGEGGASLVDGWIRCPACKSDREVADAD